MMNMLKTAAVAAVLGGGLAGGASAAVVTGSGSADVLFGDLNASFISGPTSIFVLYALADPTNSAGLNFVTVDADSFSILSASSPTSENVLFDLGGGTTFEISGFGFPMGTPALDQLTDGSAYFGLIGTLTTPDAVIPLPAGALLLGTALMGLGLARRKTG